MALENARLKVEPIIRVGGIEREKKVQEMAMAESADGKRSAKFASSFALPISAIAGEREI